MNKLYCFSFLLILFFFGAACTSKGQETNDEVSSSGEIITDPPPRLDSLTYQEKPLDHSRVYPWQEKYAISNSLFAQVQPPTGYLRVRQETGSFGDWLRYLPLKNRGSAVYLFNGQLKSNQSAAWRVVDMDVGKRDLQQCADAVMRLRAEYFFGLKQFDKIHFNFTSGDLVSFGDWRKGRRPQVSGSKVTFTEASGQIDNSYQNFRKYLVKIFSYAGTASLSKELKSVPTREMQIGDLFIQGGFPGHAVIVVDMIENQKGERLFLLAQSYMPAQETHILVNPMDDTLSPWYPLNFGETLYTPEWTFKKNDLKRFPE